MSVTVTLPIDQLQPNPFQPRQDVHSDDLTELATSIKAHGVLEPLLIAQTPAGYQIIAGERRWRAARLAGLTEVPVRVKKTTPRGMLEMALVENIQRQDLSPIERALAFQQLQRDFRYSVSQLSNSIGKSSSFVSNSLKLLSLPDAIKDGLIGNHISEGHARAILGLDTEADQVACYKLVLKEGASVRRTEDLVRRLKARAGRATSERSISNPIVSDDIAHWQSQLSSVFQTPQPQIKITRSYRQTKIAIVLKGSPEQTQQDLETLLSLAE